LTTTTTVNGKPCDFARGTTVAILVRQWCPSPRGVAVAINGEVVPRSTWEQAEVAPGDAVEIVSAAAGG
jgi:sulfur carrier protein